MLINEILTEHSDWAKLNYTELELFNLHQATRAIQHGFLKRGIGLKFSKHFFDQMKLKRGTEQKYTPGSLFIAFTHILPKLETTFEQDPTGDFVFYDPDTNINVSMIRYPDGVYFATTTIRAKKYLGTGHKVIV